MQAPHGLEAACRTDEGSSRNGAITWRQRVAKSRARLSLVFPVQSLFCDSKVLLSNNVFLGQCAPETGQQIPSERAKQAQTTSCMREAAELIHTEVRPGTSNGFCQSRILFLLQCRLHCHTPLALIRLYVPAFVQTLSRLKQTGRGGKGDRTERGCPKASLLAPLYATICTAVLGLENCSFEKGGVEAPVMYAVSSHVDATLLNSFFLS